MAPSPSCRCTKLPSNACSFAGSSSITSARPMLAHVLVALTYRHAVCTRRSTPSCCIGLGCPSGAGTGRRPPRVASSRRACVRASRHHARAAVELPTARASRARCSSGQAGFGFKKSPPLRRVLADSMMKRNYYNSPPAADATSGATDTSVAERRRRDRLRRPSRRPRASRGKAAPGTRRRTAAGELAGCVSHQGPRTTER